MYSRNKHRCICAHCKKGFFFSACTAASLPSHFFPMSVVCLSPRPLCVKSERQEINTRRENELKAKKKGGQHLDALYEEKTNDYASFKAGSTDNSHRHLNYSKINWAPHCPISQAKTFVLLKKETAKNKQTRERGAGFERLFERNRVTRSSSLQRVVNPITDWDKAESKSIDYWIYVLELIQSIV